MARYKPYNQKQDKWIPLSDADQLVPGSFEYALNESVEEHLDLRVFEARYRNDDTGRLAYDPKVLLKIVLYGYAKGMVSSRKLEEACRRHVVFMALTADSRRPSPSPPPVIEAMKRKIDTPLGRAIYARRIATVEPVFANLQNKGMRRFTLRSRRKVSTQWRLFTLVHNIEKIAKWAA